MVECDKFVQMQHLVAKSHGRGGLSQQSSITKQSHGRSEVIQAESNSTRVKPSRVE